MNHPCCAVSPLLFDQRWAQDNSPVSPAYLQRRRTPEKMLAFLESHQVTKTTGPITKGWWKSPSHVTLEGELGYHHYAFYHELDRHLQTGDLTTTKCAFSSRLEASVVTSNPSDRSQVRMWLMISGRPSMVRYVESIWLHKMVRLLLRFLSSFG